MENKIPAELMDHLAKVEQLAEDILTDKEQLIQLDKRRNKNREAIRSLKTSDENKVWMSCGNMFMKFEKKNAENILSKDQKEFDQTINKIRDDIKPKVSKLRKLEGKSELSGFNLKALSKDEISAMKTSNIFPNVI